MGLDDRRRKVFDLLQAHTQVPRLHALQILEPTGLKIGDHLFANVTDQQVDELLKAAEKTPRGPHFEAAWNDVVATFPGPAKPPAPSVQTVASPPRLTNRRRPTE